MELAARRMVEEERDRARGRVSELEAARREAQGRYVELQQAFVDAGNQLHEAKEAAAVERSVLEARAAGALQERDEAAACMDRANAELMTAESDLADARSQLLEVSGRLVEAEQLAAVRGTEAAAAQRSAQDSFDRLEKCMEQVITQQLAKERATQQLGEEAARSGALAAELQRVAGERAMLDAKYQSLKAKYAEKQGALQAGAMAAKKARRSLAAAACCSHLPHHPPAATCLHSPRRCSSPQSLCCCCRSLTPLLLPLLLLLSPAAASSAPQAESENGALRAALVEKERENAELVAMCSALMDQVEGRR